MGADLSQNEWRGVVRQLVARGYLAVDPEGYGGLQLTERARPVLRGDEVVELRRDALERAAVAAGGRRSRSRGSGLAALTADVTQLDPATEALYERLRGKRKELAEAQGVPPYVIFHDRTLAAMAVHRPTGEEAFLQLSGVGQAKLERYGEAFMAIVREDEGVAG